MLHYIKPYRYYAVLTIVFMVSEVSESCCMMVSARRCSSLLSSVFAASASYSVTSPSMLSR